MTLLEKPKAIGAPEAPVRRPFEWTMWVVLAFLIVAGVTAAILLTVGSEGVPADEVGATLAFDNYVAAHRIAAFEQAAGSDLALQFTSTRAMEAIFPGRLDMLETSAQRADQALGYAIDRALG